MSNVTQFNSYWPDRETHSHVGFTALSGPPSNIFATDTSISVIFWLCT